MYTTRTVAFLIVLALPGLALAQSGPETAQPADTPSSPGTPSADAPPGNPDAKPDPGPNAEPGNASAPADSAAAESAVQPRSKDPADSEFDNAPAPADASGVVIPRDRGNQGWRAVPRGILYPVRGLWYVIWGIPRLGMWAYDRYQLQDRFQQIFFNDSQTVGVFPVAFVETGFGLNVGARLIIQDVLAEDFKFRIRAGYGGRFRQAYSAKLSTGKLLGDTLEMELLGEYEVFSKSRFFGFGNDDEQDFEAGGALINPLVDGAAIATRYRHDDVQVELAMLGHLNDQIALRVSGRFKNRSFDEDADEGNDQEIVDVYDTAMLLGYEDGLSNIYAEAEVIYDSRRTNQFYLSPASPSTGWKLSAFAGYQFGVSDDPSGHWRWGADVQRYIDLYRGDRVLLLRAYIEGVSGQLEDVPFVDLPRLGGPILLRGYERDRFYDRNVTMATVEYNYPVERDVTAYVFADTGRVWRDLEDFEFDNFRLGFGGGLQAHTTNGFLARVFVASSIDGGIFFAFSADPVFDVRSREEAQ